MSLSIPTVLVLGATGNQGGAVARRLLQLNWNVRALARDLTAPKAESLTQAGVHLVHGDWNDEQALRDGLSGCDKLFLPLIALPMDMEAERKRTTLIVDLAKTAGVKQVITTATLGVSVYESKGNLEGYSIGGLLSTSYFKDKYDVEDIIRTAGFESCTFLRPGYFMSNFLKPDIENFRELITKGTWSTVLSASTRLGLTDHDDTAKMATALFQAPASFPGRAIGIASEFLTLQETLDRLGEAAGKPGDLRAIFLTKDEASQLPPEAFYLPYVIGDPCFEYMVELVDMSLLTGLIQPTSFAAFLEREKARVKRLS